MSAGPGHNRGPSLETGRGWRAHCWGQARTALLPVLPIEVVRMRVRRAAELGLDYKTYAGVRATTGRDIIAFLFSTNALRLLPPAPRLPLDRRARLEAIRNCGRIALVQGRLDGQTVLAIAPLDAAHHAPALLADDRAVRRAVADAIGALPRDAVVLIGDTHLERDWSVSARLAGYISADRYF